MYALLSFQTTCNCKHVNTRKKTFIRRPTWECQGSMQNHCRTQTYFLIRMQYCSSWKVPHIHVATIPESQISNRLLYGQAFSNYRPFWDKCTEWPQMTLNTKRLKLPQYTYDNYPANPKFHSGLLYGQPSSSYRAFWDKCIEWPQMTLNTKRSMVGRRTKLTKTCVGGGGG